MAIDGSEKVGMVFGELAGGEVNVRIWIHPAYRKQGYGTAALRKSRSEMAAYFPAVPLVVRAPAAGVTVSSSKSTFCSFALALFRRNVSFGAVAPPRDLVLGLELRNICPNGNLALICITCWRAC